MPTRKPIDCEIQKRGALFTAAFCVYLSAVEAVLPHPLPFLHYGLSNIPLLAALPQLRFGWFLAAALIKALGQNLIGGMLFSPLALISFCGSLTAALVMRGVYRMGRRFLTVIGVGVVSAFVSDCVRLAAASVFIGQAAASAAAVPFLLCGWICSILTGAAAVKLSPLNRLDSLPPISASVAFQPLQTPKSVVRMVPFAAAVAATISANAALCAAVFVSTIAAAIVLKVKNRWRSTAAVYVFIFVFALFSPEGEVLFRFGQFRLTAGAVETGICRASSFCALVLSSKIAVGEVKRLFRFRFLGEFFAWFEALWSLPFDGKRIFSRSYTDEAAAVLTEKATERATECGSSSSNGSFQSE